MLIEEKDIDIPLYDTAVLHAKEAVCASLAFDA